jgi:hypothetical protein
VNHKSPWLSSNSAKLRSPAIPSEPVALSASDKLYIFISFEEETEQHPDKRPLSRQGHGRDDKAPKKGLWMKGIIVMVKCRISCKR